MTPQELRERAKKLWESCCSYVAGSSGFYDTHEQWCIKQMESFATSIWNAAIEESAKTLHFADVDGKHELCVDDVLSLKVPMTSKFAEQAEKQWLSYVADKACCVEHAVKHAFLAGAEHGYRVGKDEINAAIDMSTQHTLDVMEERDHLKQQLAERDAEIERLKKVNIHWLNHADKIEKEWIKRRDEVSARLEDAERTIKGKMSCWNKPECLCWAHQYFNKYSPDSAEDGK